MFLVEYYKSVSAYLPRFLSSAVVVIELTVAIVILSLVIGFFAALGKSLKSKVLHGPFGFYIWFIRGTPALIQIFIVYFGFSQLGINFPPFVAGVMALAINSGAYIAEIFRSGFMAIPKGQGESAISLGMTRFLAFKRILFPQLLRIILPPITNQSIFILKTTSLLSAITIVELTYTAKVVVSSSYRPFDFFLICAFFYLVLTTLLTRLAKYLENRLAIAYK